MIGDAHIPAVAARVRAATAAASDRPAFVDLLLQLMARKGRILEPDGSPEWPAIVLDTCVALGGDVEAAVDAAAAVEFAVAAVDVADDLIDREWDESLATSSRAINASVALGFLAQRCLADLPQRLGPARAAGVAVALAQGSLACTAGQDLDLALEGDAAVTEEQAYDMTRRKSGSLIAMACRVGAAVATDDPESLALADAFGADCGVVAQLLNDSGGVDPAASPRGSDLRRQKKSLPVAYTLRCAREEGLTGVFDLFQRGPALSDAEEFRLATVIRDLGALQYAWIVAAAHRRQALATLRRWAKTTGRVEVLDLRRAVPQVRARRTRRAAAA